MGATTLKTGWFSMLALPNLVYNFYWRKVGSASMLYMCNEVNKVRKTTLQGKITGKGKDQI